MSDRLEYDAFFELLADMVSKGATCTIFGRTDSNRSVIVGFDGGRIVCLRCGAKKGMDAVAALRQTQWGTFRVDDALIELHSAPPPPTDDLISALHPATVLPDSGSAADGLGHQVEPTREAMLLCDLLSGYVGPVAPVLCAEEIGAIGGLEHRGQLELVLTRLAHEIDDAAEANEFLSAARRAIGPSLPPAPPDAPGPAAAPTAGPAFDATEAGSSLCRLVADYLGPVAPFVCEEKIVQVGGLNGRQELEAAIWHLAREIDQKEEAERFVARAREIFKAILD